MTGATRAGNEAGSPSRDGALAAGAAAGRPVHRVRSTCRACGSDRLRAFLSLGRQPLANAFPHEPSQFALEAFYPLDVYFCEGCSLVQLRDVIDPEVLFGSYIYVTGTSDTMAAHNQRYAQGVVDLLSLGREDLVVEIASNDGSLLSCFLERGVRVLGVEPARNIAQIAEARGVETVKRFFDLATARELRERHPAARAVIANNVLAHVDDTRDFLAGCRELAGDDGTVIVEVPYAQDMLDHLEYDTVYHEHLCYFSVTALGRLAEAVGLRIIRVDHVPVHGGTIRVFFRPGDAHGRQPLMIMEGERTSGLVSFDAWAAFGRAVDENRRATRALLERLRDDGKRIAAYGAPAKGNTFLNYCRIDTGLVEFTVDRNPLKVGTFTPGMHLPVLPVETLLERRPDYVLILAWNFADEIVRQQKAFHDSGGRFILALPTPRVIS